MTIKITEHILLWRGKHTLQDEREPYDVGWSIVLINRLFWCLSSLCVPPLSKKSYFDCFVIDCWFMSGKSQLHFFQKPVRPKICLILFLKTLASSWLSQYYYYYYLCTSELFNHNKHSEDVRCSFETKSFWTCSSKLCGANEVKNLQTADTAPLLVKLFSVDASIYSSSVFAVAVTLPVLKSVLAN